MKTQNTPGPFPLSIMESGDHYVIVTNHGSHYAKTFDPSAARLISAAPDLLSALEFLLADYIAIDGHTLTASTYAVTKAQDAIRKAKGEI